MLRTYLEIVFRGRIGLLISIRTINPCELNCQANTKIVQVGDFPDGMRTEIRHSNSSKNDVNKLYKYSNLYLKSFKYILEFVIVV